MRDYRKRIWKALTVLGILFVANTSVLVVNAAPTVCNNDDGFQWWNPMDYLRALGGFISEMAADVAEGIGRLVSGIIDAVAGVLYQLANFAVVTAIQINLMLKDSQLIKDGFGITQSIANLGIIISLVVIAFAIMTRANWLVEPRKALPKFLTTLLLMNFGYFMLMYLAVVPTNGLTGMIYKATQYTPESFRGTFNPDIDLNPALSQQIAMSKAAGACGLTGDGGENYGVKEVRLFYQLREEAVKEIQKVIDDFPIPESAAIPGALVVTDAQKLAVASAFVEDAMDMKWLSPWNQYRDGSTEGGSSPGDASWWFSASVQTIDPNSGTSSRMAEVLSAGGAPYANLDAPYPEDLWAQMEDRFFELRGQYFDVGQSGCSPNEIDCPYLTHLNKAISDQIDSVDRIIIVFAEVLFKAIFVFLGVISLLGIACMLFVRYVALSVLIILFPFVWYGWIFPKLSSAGGAGNIWQSWWSQFFRWVIFAPVCLFFLWLAIQLAVSIDEYTPTIDDMELFAGKSSLAMVGAAVGQLLTVLAFLIGGLMVANKMSIAGSGMALGIAKTGAQQIATRGGAAMARLTGRTIGTAAGLAVRGAGQATRGAGMGLQHLGAGNVGTRVARMGGVVDRAGAAMTRRSRSTTTDQPREVVTDRAGRIMSDRWRVATDAEGNRTYQQHVGNRWLDRTQREFSDAEGQVVMEQFENNRGQQEWRPVNDWHTYEDRNGTQRYEQLINGRWQERQLADVYAAGVAAGTTYDVRDGRLGLSTIADPLGRRQLRTDTSVVDRLRNIGGDPRGIGHVQQAAVETRSAWRSLFNPVREVWGAAAGSVRPGAKGGGGGRGGGRR